MTVDLDALPFQESPFDTLLVRAPSRELRRWLQLELTKRRGVLFNTKFYEPLAELPEGRCVPKLSDVVAVVLDVLSSADVDFFQNDLALVGDALGDKGSAGRSLRLVRYTLQIADLFHSYCRLGRSPEQAPDGNVNKGWQKRLWDVCQPRIQSLTQVTTGALPEGTIEHVVPDLNLDWRALVVPESVSVEWTTSPSQRAELRTVAWKICELIRRGEITDLSRCAVVLPASKAQEYSAQLSGIFSGEFALPAVLHEPMNNIGVGFARAFFALLETLQSGCGKADMQRLMLEDAFGIVRDSSDERLLSDWMNRLGVVFGLDELDCDDSYLGKEERQGKYHWLQAVNKLALAALDLPSADGRLSVSRGSLPLVQRVTSFVTTISDFRKSHGKRKYSLAEWSKVVVGFAKELCSERLSAGDVQETREFSDLLKVLERLALAASESRDIDLQMVSELLRRPLMRARRRRSGNLMSHGIAVFALRKGALRVPYTHVFLLGAEDGQIPRVDRVAGTHLFPQDYFQQRTTRNALEKSALVELFSMPQRCVFISHIERNVANGEIRRASYELMRILEGRVKVEPAPLVEAQHEREITPVADALRETLDSVDGIIDSDEQIPSNAFETRRISVNALADLGYCPFVARAKHHLRISENPIPVEKSSFEDVEFDFNSSNRLMKDVLADWMRSPDFDEAMLDGVIEARIGSLSHERAIPSERTIRIEKGLIGNVLQNWCKIVAGQRPAFRFTLGRSHQNEAIVLPELRLSDAFVLNGMLPAIVHSDGQVLTATVVCPINYGTESSLKEVHPTHSLKAMITLCALRSCEQRSDNAEVESLLKSMAAAGTWRIQLLPVFQDDSKRPVTTHFAAWTAEKSRRWLLTLANEISRKDPPDIFAIKEFHKKWTKKSRNPPTASATALTDYSVGKYPYDGHIFAADTLFNLPAETNPAERMKVLFPWFSFAGRGE